MPKTAARHPGFTESEVRGALRRVIEESDSAGELARELGVSAGFLSSVVNGRSKPSPRILDKLGLQRVDRYVPTGPQEDQ